MCVEVLLVYPGASYLLDQQSYRAGRSGFKSSHSYKLSVFFVFSFPCFSSLRLVCLRAQTPFSPEPPPLPRVWRIGLSSVMLCRAFYTPTHTHLTHTCRQAGSPLYLKALIPCHSPVPCCHALCGLPLNGLAQEPRVGGTQRVCRATAFTLTLPSFGISLTPPFIAC